MLVEIFVNISCFIALSIKRLCLFTRDGLVKIIICIKNCCIEIKSEPHQDDEFSKVDYPEKSSEVSSFAVKPNDGFSPQFNVSAIYGVTSLINNVGFPNNATEYTAPLGSNIVSWDVSSKKRTLNIQAHRDVITVLSKSLDGDILSVSYSGEAKLWTSDFKLKAQFVVAEASAVVFGSWSDTGELFSLCTEGKQTCVVTFSLADVLKDIQQHHSVKAKWVYKTDAVKLENVAKFNKADSYFSSCYFTSKSTLLAQYCGDSSFFYTFSVSDGKLLSKKELTAVDDSTATSTAAQVNFTSSIYKDMIVIGFSNDTVRLIDANTFHTISVFDTEGDACVWCDDIMIVPHFTSGTMTWWTQQGVMLRRVKGFPTDASAMVPLDYLHFWFGGVSSLNLCTLTNTQMQVKQTQTISFLKIAGCGVAMKDGSDTIACGDYAGNVFVWSPHQDKPVGAFNLSASVRAVLWFQDFILASDLNRHVYWTKELSQHIFPQVLYYFEGDVTLMKLNKESTQLACVTTVGWLYVFDIRNQQNTVKLISVYKGVQHAPVGGRPMEIWSVAWSPDSKFTATSSEDQTTIISFAQTGKVLKKLTGHRGAVTSVDWKLLRSSQNILTTCGDDQTVRIYDGIAFSLITTLNTHDIYGWHTLTYLSIDVGSDRLFVTTENGYVVVWDCSSYERLAAWKMHNGSVEGLQLATDNQGVTYINTIASDCLVNSLTLKA